MGKEGELEDELMVLRNTISRVKNDLQSQRQANASMRANLVEKQEKLRKMEERYSTKVRIAIGSWRPLRKTARNGRWIRLTRAPPRYSQSSAPPHRKINAHIRAAWDTAPSQSRLAFGTPSNRSRNQHPEQVAQGRQAYLALLPLPGP